MGVSVENEVFVFLSIVVLGVMFGFLFDLFRVLRRIFSFKTIAVAVTDIIFWIMAGVMIFGGLFYINNGQLRWHTFIGLFLGIVLYFSALSRWVIWFLINTIQVIRKIIVDIFKIVLTPIVFLYKILVRPIFFLVHIIIRGFQGFKTWIQKYIQRITNKARKKVRVDVKKQKKTRRTKQKKKISSWFLVVCVAVVLMLAKTVSEQPKITENKIKINQLNERLEYEKKRMQEIEALKEKVHTNEYIEKVAREKLGLVKENEKIFIDVSGNQ